MTDKTAMPKCKRCDDTGVWYGGVDGHIEYPCDCTIHRAPAEPCDHAPDESCPDCTDLSNVRTRPVEDDDPAEAAYWRFDARRSGYNEWKGVPQSERDAFKAEYRLALSTTPIEALQAELKIQDEANDILTAENRTLKNAGIYYQEENERLREVLKFYADDSNHLSLSIMERGSLYEEDGGQRARDALASDTTKEPKT